MPSKTITFEGHGSRGLDGLTELKFCTHVGLIQFFQSPTSPCLAWPKVGKKWGTHEVCIERVCTMCVLTFILSIGPVGSTWVHAKQRDCGNGKTYKDREWMRSQHDWPSDGLDIKTPTSMGKKYSKLANVKLNGVYDLNGSPIGSGGNSRGGRKRGWDQVGPIGGGPLWATILNRSRGYTL